MSFVQGNYGEVYRGQMTDAQGRKETVAIKSLKAVGQTDDLKREFRIMQVRWVHSLHLRMLLFDNKNSLLVFLYPSVW